MRTVNELLHQHRGHLQDLIEQSQHLQALTQKLRTLLPEHLAKHCEVAAWEETKVIIHSSNPAAGTVLRYQLPKVLPLLQLDPRYSHIQELICHNRPPVQTKTAHNVALPRPNYSDYAATLLKSMAQTVSDAAVQKSLQQLAKSISKKGTLHD